MPVSTSAEYSTPLAKRTQLQYQYLPDDTITIRNPTELFFDEPGEVWREIYGSLPQEAMELAMQFRNRIENRLSWKGRKSLVLIVWKQV